MTSRLDLDAIARTLASRSSRRTLLKGSAAVAATGVAAMAIGVRPSDAAAQDAAKLSFWFDTTGGAETAQCLIDNIITPFNDKGGAQIEATMQPNGWTATQTALSGGAGPDIVVTPGPSYVVELAKAGLILPLDDAATQYGWDKALLPWAYDLGKTGGVLYSIPDEIETLVLYYNKPLFEENGWEVPKTMDELMALSQTIADAGVIPFAHGNQDWRPTNEWFVGEFLNQVAGPGSVYAALTGMQKWTDPEFVDALTKLNEMQQNGWFMGGLDRYYTTGTADSASAFAYGDAAMKIEGTWFFSDAVSYTAEAGSDWDWTPVPSKDGTPVYDIGVGSTYSINKNTKSPEAAADFLNYYFSPETQATAVAQCGMAPAPVDIPTDLLGDIDPRQARMIDALTTASKSGDYGYTTWTFFPPKTETFIIEQIEKVWAGDMTVEEFLQGMQETFDAEIAAGEGFPVPTRG
jgi:raffinose/stachyose/melibiose transport system substrate-binding protein